MINSYVSKIRAKVSIYSKNKTSNLFDGSYKSVYQGNGMDFENRPEDFASITDRIDAMLFGLFE